MTIIPSNLARVPNQLSTRVMLSSVQRATADLLNLQVQLASGKRINRPSDDAIGTSTVSVLDDVLERRDQRLRNLSHGEAVLGTVDAALGGLSELLIEAKGIASSQIGVGSDAATRANQAQIIDAMLNEALTLGNSKHQELFVFGGSATAAAPLTPLAGGIRYRGEGTGLETDLGLARPVPVTVSGADAFGAVSARVAGDRDLDPILGGATRLADLDGARGLGVSLGAIDVQVGATVVSVDLTEAHTVQDVVDAIAAAIAPLDAGATVGIDAATQNRLEIIPSAGVTITVRDPVVDATAADLGIAKSFISDPPTPLTLGDDLDPRLTEHTRVADLPAVSPPLGVIRLQNAGQTRDVDLSGATTVKDVMNLIEGAGLGIRVEIAATGDRLDVVNELSGAAMSIGEVGGDTVAERLGVRSLTATTRLADFNDGLGVQFITGSVDPITGLPDPAADVDFRVTVKDGTQFDVDLEDVFTVEDVLDAINAAAAGAGLGVPGAFEATLVSDGNGIMLVDSTAPPGAATTVERVNGSFAATDLGILGSTTAATLVGEDRATVGVDSVFSHLIALRDALLSDDERGITLAGERLERDIARTAQVRAEVGVRSRRIADATAREEDMVIQDTGLRSQFQDLDFTEAVMRLTLLQQQLQAGLVTAGRATSLSLLDFLG
jgi:flagellin-like hook-associated protein FlgL